MIGGALIPIITMAVNHTSGIRDVSPPPPPVGIQHVFHFVCSVQAQLVGKSFHVCIRKLFSFSPFAVTSKTDTC